MALTLLLLAVGITALLVGGTLLVRGATSIGLRLGVSPMVMGLTVVAFGTSAPELVVNLIGAFKGATDIAFGNVVGSNLANLGLVLGFTSLVSPIRLQSQVMRRELPLLLLGTSVLLVMALDRSLRGMEQTLIDRADSIILLLLFGIFIYITAMDFIAQRVRDPLLQQLEGLPQSSPGESLQLGVSYTLLGLILLGIGGSLTIEHGGAFARQIGMSEVVVGILIIGVGTSLPELVTSIIAASKRAPDLALGNVIGSNIFNCLFVLPLSGLVNPLTVPAGGVVDLVMSLGFAVVILPVFFYAGARLSRISGFFLVAGYLAYMLFRLQT